MREHFEYVTIESSLYPWYENLKIDEYIIRSSLVPVDIIQ